MHSDHFYIDVDDLPLDMFRQINDPFPGCDIAIYFNEDGSLHGCWWFGEKLEISHKDAIELISMLEVYKDNQRQEMAEEGA